jgi:uncharacterized coiled-coil protein SlyX
VSNVVERIAFVEGRVEEQGRTMDGLREAVASLEGRIVSLENRMDQRFLGVDTRLDRISQQLFALIIGVAVAAAGGVLGIVTALVR